MTKVEEVSSQHFAFELQSRMQLEHIGDVFLSRYHVEISDVLGLHPFHEAILHVHQLKGSSGYELF